MIEKIKTALILLLTLLMAALLTVSLTLGVQGESGFLTAIGGVYRQYAPETPKKISELEPEAAAFPSRIAVTNRLGVYSAFSSDDYSRLYAAISGLYSEALGSLDTPELIDESEYVALLKYPSISLGFSASLPLFIHYAWTGSGSLDRPGSEERVRSVVIGQRDGAVELAFQSAGGQYFRAATGTSVTRLEGVCDSIADRPNSLYPFQSELYSGMPADEPVYEGVLKLPEFSISYPDYVSAGEVPRQVLDAFSIRHYLAGFFVSAAGVIQYAEGQMELTAGPDGELLFTNASRENPVGSGLAPGSPEHMAQAVERARQIVSEVWSKTGSPGRLSLDVMEYENGVYYLGFTAQIGGLYADLYPRPAYVIIENGYVTTVSVRPIALVQTGEASLRYVQLASSVNGPIGGRVCVVYSPRGDILAPALAALED